MQEPVLISFPGILLAGLSFWGNPFDIGPEWSEENAIGQTWRRFMALSKRSPQVFAGKGESWEVHIVHPDNERTGFREVFTGMEASSAAVNVPIELSLKRLPPTTCLKATLRGREIIDAWEPLYQEWLPASPWKPGTWLVELYDARFKGLDPQSLETSEIDALIPVEPRS